MAGQRSKNISDSSTSIPKEFYQDYRNLFTQANNAAAQVPTSPYGGRFVAQTDPFQNQGIQMRYDAAQQIPQNYGADVMKLGQQTAQGQFLHPESNPYLRGQIDAINRDTTNEYTRNILPTLQSNATGQGAFGNVRKDIGVGLAAAETQRNLLDNASNIYGQNYAMERQYQNMAPQLLQQGAQLNQLPGSVMTDIGEYRRQLQQDQIENDLLAYEDRISAPFRGINQVLPFYGLDVGQDARGVTRTKQSGMFG